MKLIFNLFLSTVLVTRALASGPQIIVPLYSNPGSEWSSLEWTLA